MNRRGENAAIVGVGAAACAVCCAGPILGFLAAIGLGTAVGAALWGVGALLAGAVAALVTVRRRRSRSAACGAGDAGSVPVSLGRQ